MLFSVFSPEKGEWLSSLSEKRTSSRHRTGESQRQCPSWAALLPTLPAWGASVKNIWCKVRTVTNLVCRVTQTEPQTHEPWCAWLAWGKGHRKWAWLGLARGCGMTWEVEEHDGSRSRRCGAGQPSPWGWQLAPLTKASPAVWFC